LGHVERCSVLLHLVDGTGEDVADDYRIISNELEKYAEDLAKRPRIVALNKVDALQPEARAEKLAELEAAVGGKVYAMSAVSREGVTDVLRALKKVIDGAKVAEVVAKEEPQPWKP
jgi:GTP-binding protein